MDALQTLPLSNSCRAHPPWTRCRPAPCVPRTALLGHTQALPSFWSHPSVSTALPVMPSSGALLGPFLPLLTHASRVTQAPHRPWVGDGGREGLQRVDVSSILVVVMNPFLNAYVET